MEIEGQPESLQVILGQQLAVGISTTYLLSTTISTQATSAISTQVKSTISTQVIDKKARKGILILV